MAKANHPEEVWTGGSAYESYMGRWSSLVSEQFLSWLAVPPGSRWLDVGCGTGALCRAILASESPRSVKGIDSAEEYIAYARNQVSESRIRFAVGRAENLDELSGTYDATVMGLVLNFVPRPRRALAGMRRVTRPDGTVAAYVWDYADKMEFLSYFWDAAATLDPRARELNEGARFPICHPPRLSSLWRNVGLTAVETRAIEISTHFKDFQDYWTPFLGGQGPAPAYVTALAEEQRDRLRRRVRSALPVAEDGSIRLTARAWAVRGLRQRG